MATALFDNPSSCRYRGTVQQGFVFKLSFKTLSIHKPHTIPVPLLPKISIQPTVLTLAIFSMKNIS